MKLPFALALQALLFSAVAQASFIRRRPHDSILHRRNGDESLFGHIHDDVSSLWNGLAGSHSDSSSSSASDSSSEGRVAHTNSSHDSSLVDWLNGVLGGIWHGDGHHGFYKTNPSTGRLLANKPKLGLAWPNGGSMNITHFMTKKVSWFYSWDATPGFSPVPENITFCPMLWGQNKISHFKKHVLGNINSANNAGKCVLGMNEVNQQNQAKMSEGEACSMMRENIMPLKAHDFYVVSPVTTNAPSGMKWMKNFRKQCSDVWNMVDAVAVHYYGTNTTEFKQYVSEWHDTFNKPVWVTEYACQDFNGGEQCSDSEVYSFHMEMAIWFDKQNFVEAYAPFGVMQNLQGVNKANSLQEGREPNFMYNSISSVP